MAQKIVPRNIEISGPWTFFDASQDASTNFAQPDFDDSSWDVDPHISRPSEQVRRFRTQVKTAASAQGKRNWLVFEGVSSDAHVWIDGTYLGDVDGLIVPTAFEVTDALLARDEHVIALQIPSDATVSESAPVRIVETGPVRISRFRAICTEASEEQASISISAELDARTPFEAIVRTTTGGTEFEFQRGLAAGRNRLRWNVQVEKPELWWPNGFGVPSLSPVAVTVSDKRHPARVSDKREVKIGYREVEIRRGFLHVNGERMLVRACSAAQVKTATGVNAVLCDEPSITAETLDFADEKGLIAIHPAYTQAKHARQATEAFGHHPSLVAWIQEEHMRWILRRAESTKRAISRADASRPQIHPLPEVKSLHQLDGLRRSRRLLHGYVIAGNDPELLSAIADSVRVSISVRRTARRRDTQQLDVHVINDTATDIENALIRVAAAWNDDFKDWRWSTRAGAASSTYAGTMSLPGHIDAPEVRFSWRINDEAGGEVTRRVGSDGMILGRTGVKRQES